MSLSRIYSFGYTCALFIALLCSPAFAGDTIFQYSTIDALLGSLYDGRMTIQELKYKGDFGLGTLNGIDGELVVLDGEAYHIRAGGKATIPESDALVPFASVSFFDQDSALSLGAMGSLEALNQAVFQQLPSRNLFYAIRIDGEFPMVKARAIPKQKAPYKPLAQVVKKQVVVTFSGPGTLVGYYSPPFVKGVNVPGFHWHFLTGDRTGGGHVLDCETSPSVAKLDSLNAFSVQLPADKAFDALDLSGDKNDELHAVEKDPVKKQ